MFAGHLGITRLQEAGPARARFPSPSSLNWPLKVTIVQKSAVGGANNRNSGDKKFLSHHRTHLSDWSREILISTHRTTGQNHPNDMSRSLKTGTAWPS